METQLQMRRNVEQMHQTADELDSWLGDIGKRDASLRGKAVPTGGRAKVTAGDETDEEEEAREIEEAKEELRQERLRQETAAAETKGEGAMSAKKAAKAPQTHAQKYGQWDQYDADEVVRGIEEKEADQERLRKEVVRLENRRAQSKARKAAAAASAAAEALRLQGNEAFGAARYEEAVGKYTDALVHMPRSATLYANRALGLLKLHAYAEAEEDCDAALLIEPAHVKALLRRAQARHAGAKYDSALEDLERALEVEPRNSAARALMSECRRFKTLATPRPKAPLVKVAVEEVEHDPDNDDDAFVLALAEEPPSGLPNGDRSPTSSAASSAATSTASASSTDSADVAEGAGEVDGGTATEKSAAGGESVKAGGRRPTAGGGSAAAAGRARAVPTAAPTAESFALPSSLADMERGWRSLRGSPDEWAAWVGRIDPSAMINLFRTSLPADLFSAILVALDTYLSHSDPTRTLAILRALTSAGRFSILTMCLDKADRLAIDAVNIRLIEAQGRGEIPPDENLEALRKQYE